MASRRARRIRWRTSAVGPWRSAWRFTTSVAGTPTGRGWRSAGSWGRPGRSPGRARASWTREPGRSRPTRSAPWCARSMRSSRVAAASRPSHEAGDPSRRRRRRRHREGGPDPMAPRSRYRPIARRRSSGRARSRPPRPLSGSSCARTTPSRRRSAGCAWRLRFATRPSPARRPACWRAASGPRSGAGCSARSGSSRSCTSRTSRATSGQIRKLQTIRSWGRPKARRHLGPHGRPRPSMRCSAGRRASAPGIRRARPRGS